MDKINLYFKCLNTKLIDKIDILFYLIFLLDVWMIDRIQIYLFFLIFLYLIHGWNVGWMDGWIDDG